MTTEQAKSELMQIYMSLSEEKKKALDVAFKAMEQADGEYITQSAGDEIRQKNYDSISRHAVNVLVDELARAISDERCCMSRGRSTATIMQDILDLPPVKPQEKTGYWYIDERPESDRKIICSNCEQPIFKYHKIDFDYRPKYCPNCGVKMVEPQERENKCKKCEYYRNPDYTRCRKCEAESEDKE